MSGAWGRPRLGRRLVLEVSERLPDGGGGGAEVWVALGELWAEVRAVAGREEVAGGRERSFVTHRILVRASPPGSPRRPRADQRFREGSRVFGIVAVAEADPAGRYLVCWVEEGRGG